MGKMISGKHLLHDGDRAPAQDCKAMAHSDEERLRLLYMINIGSESPEAVLREAYISAKDIAVERPLPFTTTPPVNFAMVAPGLYRSGYPQAPDYSFMRTLNLKTIVTLVGKELPDGYQEFIKGNHIKHEIFDMAGTKKADIPAKTMQSIIAVVGNRKNYPLLIHCNQGKHRTGCVVGILRKASEWDTTSIIREYTKFAEPKVRETDVKYITDFSLSDLKNVVPKPSRLPFIQNTFYGMVMVASFTLSVWMYSTKLLLLTTT
ncbi:tyrosine phosphatase family-domain-containing protein [Annulohypoxylon maeteangense]|uniref:tyrosine phosphatase family-domain-containing protein n=1 Tax=Annulohypoxylon maeteangense TaxID=1927788 RepID=UPI002008D280|nr:tyrosine phosphatase family-domain-containing protein [Annulohypoxylon maeteangense]KAI0885035.1 tyrosine phosphatase family-domain-containing protein [Annulohypoxylon maeteangense]